MKLLRKYNMDHYFSFVKSATLFDKTTQIKRILKKSKIKSEEAIYIGDEIRDIHAARAVGIDSGVVSWGYNDIEALNAEKPDQIYYDMNEIYERNI